MKKIILTVAASLIGIVAFSQKDQYVNGYTKSNGTVVQGYHKTAPNNTVYDNYSTAPNVNPYTGKTGTKNYNNSTTNYNSNYSTNYNSNRTGNSSRRRR